MTKIAYLMSVRIWGDRAIQSTSGEMYRRALRSTDKDALSRIGFKGGMGNALEAIFNKRSHHEHLLISFIQGTDLVSIVSLFGTFTATYISPGGDFGAEEADGQYVIFNVSKSQMQCRSFLEELVSIAQKNIWQSL